MNACKPCRRARLGGRPAVLAGAGSDQAAGAFEAVVAQNASTEARCKYGVFLLGRGNASGARRAFENVLRDATLGHHHSRELNREWIDRARLELKRLDT